jgi:hypothetical protein
MHRMVCPLPVRETAQVKTNLFLRHPRTYIVEVNWGRPVPRPNWSRLPPRPLTLPTVMEGKLRACFIVRDHDKQALAYVYFENEPGRR